MTVLIWYDLPPKCYASVVTSHVSKGKMIVTMIVKVNATVSVSSESLLVKRGLRQVKYNCLRPIKEECMWIVCMGPIETFKGTGWVCLYMTKQECTECCNVELILQLCIQLWMDLNNPHSNVLLNLKCGSLPIWGGYGTTPPAWYYHSHQTCDQTNNLPMLHEGCMVDGGLTMPQI